MTSGNPSEKTNTKKTLPPAVKNFRKITITTTKLTTGGGVRSRGKKWKQETQHLHFHASKIYWAATVDLRPLSAAPPPPTSPLSPSFVIVLPAFQRQKPLQNIVFSHCLLWFSSPFPLRNQKLLENWIEISYVRGRCSMVGGALSFTANVNNN